MLIDLNIKFYYNYHINLLITWPKKMRSRSYDQNEEYIYTLQSFNTNQVKVRWHLAQKLNTEQWTSKMRSRSNETCETDIIRYFQTPNKVDLLHIVLEKTNKTQKLNFDHWTKEMRSRSDDTCQLDMYTLQSFHTPNIQDIFHIVSEI